MAKLSYSQLQTWNSCKAKWKYQYKERLTPRVDRPRLDLGSAVGRGMETQLLNWDDPMGAAIGVKDFVDEKLEKGLTSDEEEILLDLAHQATQIAEGLFANVKANGFISYCVDGKPLVEHKMETALPVVGWEGFKGFLDWVAVEQSTGFVWLVDFKVRKAFQQQEAEEFNIQMAVYQHMLRKAGIDVKGSISWQAKNTAPKDPKLTTKGAMSRAKIVTTWSHYKACLLKAGLDPAEYEEDMKPKCDEIEWFRLSRAFRNSEEVANIWGEVEAIATQMMRPQPLTRSLSFMNCRGCSYAELCLEELRGRDVEYIRKTRFRSMDVQVNEPEEIDDEDLWAPPEITE